MKILLVNPSWGGRVQSGRYNRSWPPLDLLNLAALLQEKGHDASICDARADRSTPESLSHRVKHADLVIMTTSPLDRWQCPNVDLNPLLQWTRVMPSEKLVLCGVHGALFPEELIRLTGARMVLTGEPESTVLDLIRALVGNVSLNDVPGLCRLENGQYFRNSPAPPCDLAALPLPAYSLINPELYRYELLGRNLALLETARGCPHRCTFCLKVMYGSRVRMKSQEQLSLELESIRRLGFRTVYFIDLEFTLFRDRTLELCRIFKEVRLPWCCQTRVDAVDPDLLVEMKKSGCKLIHYGIESGSLKTRELTQKSLSNRQIEQAIEWTREAGIAAAGFFLLGFPWETKSDIEETGRFARQLPLSYASFHQVTPYPGTALAENAAGIPWWNNPPDGWEGRPDLTGLFLRFYLRPGYLIESFRNHAGRHDTLRLFWDFLSGMCPGNPSRNESNPA